MRLINSELLHHLRIRNIPALPLQVHTAHDAQNEDIFGKPLRRILTTVKAEELFSPFESIKLDELL